MTGEDPSDISPPTESELSMFINKGGCDILGEEYTIDPEDYRLKRTGILGRIKDALRRGDELGHLEFVRGWEGDVRYVEQASFVTYLHPNEEDIEEAVEDFVHLWNTVYPSAPMEHIRY